MKVLITGHMGLIGSRFAKCLAENPRYELYGIDDLSGGLSENKTPEVTSFNFDLADQGKVNQAFEEIKPDYVYHFAAYAAEGLSPYIRNYNYTNNLLASVNVINACINNDVKKIIFTSSMAVMGHGNPPFKESDPVRPDDPYGNAKAAVETDLALAKKHFGLDYTIVRPHNVIGIGQNLFDRYRNVIGIFIRQLITGKVLTIYGDGNQKRAFSDVHYILDPLESLMEKGSGEIYNLGADTPYTINEVAEMVLEAGRAHGYSSKIVHLEERQEVKYAYCDHAKAKKDLGFYDATHIQYTIDEMIEWALELKFREVESIGYEVNKRMYSFWK
jgi:UDP-glucose 4-epimerase